jgi:hypothetical protein
MRQMFSSPRLENVEAVAKLFEEAGIEHKISEGRGYKKVSRREFSYVEKNNNANLPAIWVIKSEDYKRAREMLHDMGLEEGAPASSYVPEVLQFREPAKTTDSARLSRIRIALLFAVGAMGAWMIIRTLLLP